MLSEGGWGVKWCEIRGYRNLIQGCKREDGRWREDGRVRNCVLRGGRILSHSVAFGWSAWGLGFGGFGGFVCWIVWGWWGVKLGFLNGNRVGWVCLVIRAWGGDLIWGWERVDARKAMSEKSRLGSALVGDGIWARWVDSCCVNVAVMRPPFLSYGYLNMYQTRRQQEFWLGLKRNGEDGVPAGVLSPLSSRLSGGRKKAGSKLSPQSRGSEGRET
jgi:hypothetical protein